MINNSNPLNPNSQFQKRTPSLAATALGGLIAGVVSGATVAAASNARKVKNGCMTPKEATAEVVREAGSMGLATTVGVTTTALLGVTGIMSVAGVALVTASTKYAIDSLLNAPACEINTKVKEKEVLEENSNESVQEAEII